MLCCIHDPGMALFIAETRAEDGSAPGPLGWTAFAASLLLAAIALSLPA